MCVASVSMSRSHATSPHRTVDLSRPTSVSPRAESSLTADFSRDMQALPAESVSEAPHVADLILQAARRHRASDIHLVPTGLATRMQWRIDGVLQQVAEFDTDLGTRLLARFKVMCGLLTYRTDVPQEGRIAREHSDSEVRISTLPTLHGEKIAIRLFAQNDQLQRVDQLGLPQDVADGVTQQLGATSGVILLTGPSGSGKTTTAYACLRNIIANSADQRSVMTLEDPIEVAVDGTTQSQVRPTVGFDLAAGLKAMMRQDPDVIFVGEIRDPSTAESVFQAALTGHLVITTFHAGSAAEAIGRLLEMQIEPYLMRSTIRTITCQRLLRRHCQTCQCPDSVDGFSDSSDNSRKHLDQDTACTACGGTGYHGRLVLAEMLDLSTPEMARVILQRCDASEIASAAASTGMTVLAQRAAMAVNNGDTSQDEVFRVLGRHVTSG
jgi:general secretion pathway protein E